MDIKLILRYSLFNLIFLKNLHHQLIKYIITKKSKE